MSNFNKLISLITSLNLKNSEDDVLHHFMSGINEMIPNANFKWLSNGADRKCSVQVRTSNHYYGDISSQNDLSPFNSSLLKQGACMLAVVLENIRDRNRKIEELMHEREKYQLLFKNSPIGVFTYNSDGKVIDANDKLIDILGSPGVQATKAINVFTLPALMESGISNDLMECLNTGFNVSNIKYYKSKWGRKLYLKYTITPLLFEKSKATVAQVIVEDFTRFKETEEAMLNAKRQAEKSEKKVKSLINAIPDLMFVFNDKGYIIDYNANEGLLYTPPELFLQKHVSESLPGYLAELTIEKIKETIETNTVQEYEYSIFLDDNERIYDARMVPLSNNQVLSIVRDMTLIKGTQRKLKDSNKELEFRNQLSNSFLRITDNAFFDEVLRLLLQHFQCKYGYFGYINENGNLVCPTLTRNVYNYGSAEKDIVFYKEGWAGLWGDSLIHNKTLFKNSGFQFPQGHLELSNVLASPINDQDKNVIGQIVLADKYNNFNENDAIALENICKYISPLLTARLKENRYKTQLIRSKERAEQSDKLKSAFLANLSHEIRTPMNGIVGFAQLLKKEGLHPAKANRYIDIIGRQSQQLLGIISDIVDISKLDTGQLSVFNDEIFVEELIDDLYAIFSREYNSDDLKFTTQKDTAVESIISDKTKIQQILSNLLNNAFKHTKEGRITLGYFIENEFLRFYVSDTGPGIEKKDQSRIFHRFVQLNTQRKKSGTGLGLSICKGMADLLGGSIHVESVKGQGSTFYFNFKM